MESSEESKTSAPPKSKKQSKFMKLQEQVDETVREEWAEEQARLKEQLIEENKFDWYEI